MRWGLVIRTAPFVVYPLVVYVALEYVEAKYLGVVLLALLALRHRGATRRLINGLSAPGWIALALVSLFAFAVWWFNNELLLRTYPALLNLFGLSVFAYTLYNPPSMIERFARLHDDALSAATIRYTERVTWVWCGFFVLNGTIAAYTAVYATRELWALYNGFIAYCLMGALFLGEWLVRRHFVTREAAR